MLNRFEPLKIITFISILFLSSCSFLLYHPSRDLLIPPEKLGIPRNDYEDIYFRSLDGTRLHGWFFHSKVKPSRGVVIFFHGNAENLTSHYASLVWITKHGFDLFAFDYRGYGASDGYPTPEGTVADGRSALRYASQMNKPLIVYLQSLGGAIGLRSLIEEFKLGVGTQNGMQRPKVVFAESTFHSYQAIGRDVLSRSAITWIFQPLSYLLLSDSMAPASDLDRISPTPLVVIHGTHDSVVPYYFGQKVFELAKEPKFFWSIQNGNHIDALWQNGESLKTRVIIEIERNLNQQFK